MASSTSECCTSLRPSVSGHPQLRHVSPLGVSSSDAAYNATGLVPSAIQQMGDDDVVVPSMPVASVASPGSLTDDGRSLDRRSLSSSLPLLAESSGLTEPKRARRLDSAELIWRLWPEPSAMVETNGTLRSFTPCSNPVTSIAITVLSRCRKPHSALLGSTSCGGSRAFSDATNLVTNMHAPSNCSAVAGNVCLTLGGASNGPLCHHPHSSRRSIARHGDLERSGQHQPRIDSQQSVPSAT